MKYLILAIRVSRLQVERHFGKNFSISQNNEVHFCDITNCVKINRTYNKPNLTTYTNITISNFYKYEQLESYLNNKKIANCKALLIGWQILETQLIEILNKNKVELIRINNLPPGKHNSFQYFKQLIKFPFLYHRNKHKTFLIEGLFKKKLLSFQGYKTIMMHSWEYDNYLLRRNNKIQEKDNVITYIDQNLIAHNDFNDFNITRSNIAKYYNELNILFNRLKQKGYIVKIALHPSASIETYRNLITDSDNIFKGLTYDLIDESFAVIGHYSLSINYAILKDKMISLIEIPTEYSKELYDFGNSLSKQTKIPLLKPRDNIMFTKINPITKINYIKNYLAGDYPNDNSLFSNKLINVLTQ